MSTNDTTYTTYTINTRSKASFAIVYVGPRGGDTALPTLEGYAHTAVKATARARRMGRFNVALPIVNGVVTVDVTGTPAEAAVAALG